MLNRITRKLAVGVTLIALVTPAFAQMGTDPEPRPHIVHAFLVFLGLA